MDIAYRIKEGQEEGKDKSQLVIVKTGHEVELTLANYDSYVMQNAKHLKEITAQRDYEEAIITNIEQHHPFVTQMPSDQLVTCWLYKEAKGKVDIANAKLKEINFAQRELEQEKVAIIEALPELKVEETVEQSNEEKS